MNLRCSSGTEKNRFPVNLPRVERPVGLGTRGIIESNARKILQAFIKKFLANSVSQRIGWASTGIACITCSETYDKCIEIDGSSEIATGYSYFQLELLEYFECGRSHTSGF